MSFCLDLPAYCGFSTQGGKVTIDIKKALFKKLFLIKLRKVPWPENLEASAVTSQISSVDRGLFWS